MPFTGAVPLTSALGSVGVGGRTIHGSAAMAGDESTIAKANRTARIEAP
jgi:hypothetical protein